MADTEIMRGYVAPNKEKTYIAAKVAEGWTVTGRFYHHPIISGNSGNVVLYFERQNSASPTPETPT